MFDLNLRACRACKVAASIFKESWRQNLSAPSRGRRRTRRQTEPNPIPDVRPCLGVGSKPPRNAFKSSQLAYGPADKD
jgi:hypothetical protein